MTGDQAKALAALNGARRVAPQQTKLDGAVPLDDLRHDQGWLSDHPPSR